MDLLCSWATANAKTTVSSLTRGSEKVNSSQSPRCNKKPLILDGRLPHISCRCRDKALGTECFLFFDLQPLTPRSSLGNSDWLLWIISCCSCSSSLYLNCCRTCWDTEEVTENEQRVRRSCDLTLPHLFGRNTPTPSCLYRGWRHLLRVRTKMQMMV